MIEDALGNDQPDVPGYALAASNLLSPVGAVSFRLLTFDPSGALLQAVVSFLKSAQGLPFTGASGIPSPSNTAAIRGFRVDAQQEMNMNGESDPESPMNRSAIDINLISPLQLRTHLPPVWLQSSQPPSTEPDNYRNLLAEELTFSHLCCAAVRRLNELSQIFGNALVLDEAEVLMEAAFVRELNRSLRSGIVRHGHRAKVRDGRLDGVTGVLTTGPLSPPLREILRVAGTLQVGNHTTGGCGSFNLTRHQP